jgi:hypothetical protein
MTAPKAPKTFRLSEPVSWEGKEITEITITKPKVKDLKRMNAELADIKDQLEQGIAMAATLSGLPVEVIEELDTDDFTAVSEVIAGFFPQATASRNGEPSSPKPPTG